MITDPSGKTVSYGYDSNGDLTAFTNVYGTITQYAYDSEHNLTSITDPSGVQTLFTIDDEDRLASVSNGSGVNSRTYEYSVPMANQMTVTDALGNETVYTFDNHGSITTITDPHGIATSMVYDENLNLTHLTDADGNQTTFTYDDKGNLSTTTDAQGNTTTTTYESQFNQVNSLYDANGNTTSFTYDSYGNLTAKNYPNGNTESFTYNGSGNLISLTDANGNTTTFEYDASGHMTRMTYPNGSSESFIYDTFGNLASKTDRMGRTIAYDYDLAGRLITKTYPNGTSVGFGYDDAGKLVTAEDENGAINFEYDTTGRLTQVTNQDGDIVSYGYDNAGNRTHLTYPNGMVLEYSYDELNRLTRISESGQMVAEYSYDNLNRVVRRELQNGNYSTYDYDRSNHLLELVNRKSTSEIISSFAYTYDNVGNRLTMRTLEGLTQYTYDNRYQLTEVIYPDGSMTSYDFDQAGNRISEMIDGDRIDYTTNNLNQYTDVNGDTYTYDANGNMTSKTNSSGKTIYTYDFENRLVQVDTVTETITYSYDPFGRRTSKTISSGKTNYVYDGFRVIMEKDDSNTINAAYIHGIWIDEVLVMKKGSIDYFYSQDGLGSVSDLTDPLGNVVESFTYGEYGMPSNVSSVGNPYLFTGREYEPATGFFYYRARYYDPSIGRFSSTDPIGYLGGVNMYRYVYNNPINWINPKGLDIYYVSQGGHQIYGITDPTSSTGKRWYEFFPSGNPFLSPGEWRVSESKPWGWLYRTRKTTPQQDQDLLNTFNEAVRNPHSYSWDIDNCITVPTRIINEILKGNPQDGGGGNDDSVLRGDPTFIQAFKTIDAQSIHYKPISDSKSLIASIVVPNEASLVRANVPIFGQAYGKEFKGYQVAFGKGITPFKWFHIYSSTKPQTKKIESGDLDDSLDLTIQGNLATWDTGLKNYVYLPSHPKGHPIDLKGTYTIAVCQHSCRIFSKKRF